MEVGKKKILAKLLASGEIDSLHSLEQYGGDFNSLAKDYPVIREIAAEVMYGRYAATVLELEALCMPNLAPAMEETEHDYVNRLLHCIKHSYFVADSLSDIMANKVKFIVCSDPFQPELDSYLGLPIVITTPEVIASILNGQRGGMIDIAPFSEDEPIEVWINRLLTEAYNRGAADVEITAHPSAMRVRFHMHGEWTDWICSIPILQRPQLMRSLCASAHPSMDYKQGTTHDFKIERHINGLDTSWRASIVPATLGDSINLRLLPKVGGVPTLDELGYEDRARYMLKKTAAQRDGFIIFSGQTGSGKTTALYSIIELIRDMRRKVCTIEDPVELTVAGIVQVQVNDGPEIEEQYKMTFASGIRSFMRHKPDVIVVGETRDDETAAAGVGASRTGHLTYTTLHTTSVKTSVKRMLDMGVDAINLSDTLTMVVSQHLVNTLCPYCKLENEDGTAEKNDDGCETCEDRGVLGRTVVYEMAWLDDMARESIIDGKLHEQFERLRGLGRYISKADTIRRLVSEGKLDVKALSELEEDYGI